MASIDIFPLTIGGVQPPLNLLSNIFSPPQGSKNFSYPLDLATNPTFAHAIQFTIFDYSYPGLSGAAEGFLGALGQTISSASGSTSTISNLIETIGNTGKAASNLLGPSLQFIQPQTYKQVRKGSPLSTISLYMPDTVNTTYDSNYKEVSMTDTIGLAGYISNALGDANIKNFDFKDLPTNLLASQNVKQLGAMLAGGVGDKLGMQGGDLTAVLQKAFGQIPNPQMQLIYKGISLRQFQFEFIFTPISAKEAAMVDQIIKKFVYYSVPALSTATNGGQYLVPPQIFRINFIYTGNSGALGAITNVFNNTLTNVLGSQISGLFSGSVGLSASQNSAKLFTIQDCVLENVNVDYAPNGWAAYSDGYPVQTRLTLQFKEMDIVTKDKVDPNQWAADSATAAMNNSIQSAVQNFPNETVGSVAASNPDTYAAVGELPIGPTLSSVGGQTYTDLINMPGSP